jgi:hypothetical protein
LQHQFFSPLGLGDLPFIVGRRRIAGEGLPPWQPDLELNDTAPFRLSRNHFVIEKHDGGYRVRDLCSTLGTIVNGEPIGHCVRVDAFTAWGHFSSDAPLRAGENEVIAGGADSPFVFSVFIPSGSGTSSRTISARPTSCNKIALPKPIRSKAIDTDTGTTPKKTAVVTIQVSGSGRA